MDEITLDEKEEPVFRATTVWLSQTPFLALEDLKELKGKRNVARWIRKIVTREIDRERERAKAKELAEVG